MIRHTGIYVKDLERMKDFYCRHFDMEVAVHDTEKGAYIEKILGIQGIRVDLYKLIRRDGTMLELLKPGIEDNCEAYADSMTYNGCLHIAFTVDDLRSLYEEMRTEGVEFISEPTISPNKKACVCFCRDPEGNYLELVQELGGK